MNCCACVYRHGTSRTIHYVADDSCDLEMGSLCPTEQYPSLNEPEVLIMLRYNLIDLRPIVYVVSNVDL